MTLDQLLQHMLICVEFVVSQIVKTRKYFFHPLRYLSTKDVFFQATFIDILVWAVLKNYTELAKVIWKRTHFLLHSAILASNLYHQYTFLQIILINEGIDICLTTAFVSVYVHYCIINNTCFSSLQQDDLENALWFENEVSTYQGCLEFELIVCRH